MSESKIEVHSKSDPYYTEHDKKTKNRTLTVQFFKKFSIPLQCILGSSFNYIKKSKNFEFSQNGTKLKTRWMADSGAKKSGDKGSILGGGRCDESGGNIQNKSKPRMQNTKNDTVNNQQLQNNMANLSQIDRSFGTSSSRKAFSYPGKKN